MKNLKLLIAFSLLLAVKFVDAQFIKSYDNGPEQGIRFAALVPVDETTSSNLYLAGSNEGYLTVGEIDQTGVLVWNKRINAKDTSMTINQMIKDSDGNLVIVGTSVAGDLGKSFVIKFDPVLQDIVWFRKCTVNSFFWDVVELGPGCDYLVGGQETNNGTGAGSDDITIKFKRASGAQSVITNLNKNMNESVEAVAYDPTSSSIYSTGRYELSTGGNNKFRICINKFDATGTIDWTRSYIKSTATSGRFYSEDMLIDGEHIIVIGSGDDVSTSSNKYFWFIKTDLSGEAVITRKIDVTSAFYDGVFAGIKKHESGYIVYGSLYQDGKYTNVCLYNLDFDGNVVWAKSYPFRLRYPTTGLFSSSAMTIVGDDIFVVGEQVGDGGTVEGIFMKTSILSGEVAECETAISNTTTVITNYDNFETLESETVTLSYPSSFPGIKPLALNMSTVCSLNKGKVLLPSSNSESFIYPNPSNEFIYMNEIQGYNFEDKVIITDIAGKAVATCNLEALQHGFSISSFAPGMYFVTIVNNKTSATISCTVVKE